MKIYSSIVPSRMTNIELIALCKELRFAKILKAPFIFVKLKNGLGYKLELSRYDDYKEQLNILLN